MKFVPLQAGEYPGDPELGGWRPLPRAFSFAGRTVRELNTSALQVSTSPVISLEKAITVLARHLEQAQLWQAIKALEQKLSTAPRGL
jgi:hypothetical protein